MNTARSLPHPAKNKTDSREQDQQRKSADEQFSSEGTEQQKTDCAQHDDKSEVAAV